MNNLEHLGVDNWLEDKIDLNKNPDFKIARVNNVNKNRKTYKRI